MKKYFTQAKLVKNVTRLSALTLLLAVTGCKKDKNQDLPQNPASSKVSRIEVDGNIAGSFTYDAAGRLTEYLTVNSKTVYDYSGNSFAYKWYSGNQLKNEGKNALIASGRLTTILCQNYNQGVPSNNYSFNFTYNPDGTLKSYTDGSSQYEYSYLNGNFSTSTRKINGMLNSTSTYEYYTDADNKFNLPLMEYFFEYPFLTNSLVGTKNQQLIKKATKVQGANTYITEITYNKDAAGLVTSYTQVYKKNNDTPVTSTIYVFY